ncbi:MAG: hypothetical protein A3E01_02470 [Gammaproteobacteria bacterium RIFCSPHIGHO2_12_FULL_63_22]|nr:MAG: hypothetical protein A3E01_02470 [Gammaproteobacteria bacterium RIFCSPHIGHO2_12_FULL_63_22]
MSKPRLLDLFCGAGGAARGYQEAGFYVVGVDNKPQPRYAGDEFILGDAMTFPLDGFEAIHASPPCQAYSEQTPLAYRANHPQLIETVSTMLRCAGKPYVIENVAGARGHLRSPFMLCGTMFGLNLWRHRYFETGGFWVLAPGCQHDERPVVFHPGSNARAGRRGPVSITGTTRRRTGRFEWSVQECRDASELQWMTRKELDEAIPPAYTRYIGAQLLRYLEATP